MKVMIVVTHLLGTGHLSRALTLGRAFVVEGHETFVVSGGMPAPQLDSTGMTLLGLPPLRSDGTDFTRLLTQNGDVADEAYLAARQTALIAAVRSFQPDALITELFPFGRRSLTAEFTAALETARDMRPRPVILGSVRDILAPPSKPSKAERTDEIVRQFYDRILVHSDPNVVPLNTSWPVSEELTKRLHYTGFVAPAAPTPHSEAIGKDEVLVSAGGGSVGQADLSSGHRGRPKDAQQALAPVDRRTGCTVAHRKVAAKGRRCPRDIGTCAAGFSADAASCSGLSQHVRLQHGT